eukprot:5264211-Pyramimonas_sp.AAC.1
MIRRRSMSRVPSRTCTSMRSPMLNHSVGWLKKMLISGCVVSAFLKPFAILRLPVACFCLSSSVTVRCSAFCVCTPPPKRRFFLMLVVLNAPPSPPPPLAPPLEGAARTDTPQSTDGRDRNADRVEP